MVKRIIDLALSTVLIIGLLPLMVCVGICIYLVDGPPVLYRQIRVGFRGVEFKIVKFRSMVFNADVAGGYSTLPNDRRVTRLGQIIRRTSIDELPQLFNVIIGDMSLVGPRPDVPAQSAQYTVDEWQKRHSIKPGITGLAQATLRSEATPEERKKLDFDYIDNRSLVGDVLILFYTLKQIISKGGN